MVEQCFSNSDILQVIRDGISSGMPVEEIIQDKTGLPAYVMHPNVSGKRSYYKVQFDARFQLGERMIVISCHPDNWKSKRKK